MASETLEKLRLSRQVRLFTKKSEIFDTSLIQNFNAKLYMIQNLVLESKTPIKSNSNYNLFVDKQF